MAGNIPPSAPPLSVKPVTLIPVGLKEAALDSPTFRSGFTHFAEQLDLVEKWLFGYYRCITKLTHEMGPFETTVNNFLAQCVPPSYVSEAVIDHDYTLLAMRRYGEAVKEFWFAAVSGLKRMEINMIDPIKGFLYTDLQSFKDVKRNVEITQKQLDSLQSRYASQARIKEPSSLREDAFQLHEARKAYLKASMDFSVAAPQLRMTLDKMLVKVFSDQWRDIRDSRLSIGQSIDKWGMDIERVRGWSRDMENSEKAFRRELQNARRQIEEDAGVAIRPSRELEDYALESTPTSKQKGPSATTAHSTGIKLRPAKAEKQGWLNLRTVAGKPSRTVWSRRWFYVKNGIFGWLIQGLRSGAVEESEKIGVLLCNVKGSSSDDRRYIFEVKTKDNTITVQAETQPELNDWLSTFDVAKQKALEDPASTGSRNAEVKAQDAAFAISPPSAPEFAASIADANAIQLAEDSAVNTIIDRSSTLPVPGVDLTTRNSFDVTSTRRSSALENNGDTSRDPTSRLISKLDLHRKPLGSSIANSPVSPGISGGGVASLIAASHGSMPVGPGTLPVPPTPELPSSRKILNPLATFREIPTSSLAPNTLANPPAPTNLSMTAVIVVGERNIDVAHADSSGGVPGALLANIWGSSHWGFLNILEQEEAKENFPSLLSSPHNSPLKTSENSNFSSPSINDIKTPISSSRRLSGHQKTVSLDREGSSTVAASKPSSLEFSNYYPLQLKAQNAQFRLLFPNAPREERIVFVFKATWNPNDQQEFPGRVYVTPQKIYFYSNHCGMTMTASLRLNSIDEVTAANGRDWDVVFLHLKEANEISGFTRITIKTFLEPLKLVQRRLSFLAKNASGNQSGIEDILKHLIKLEQDEPGNTPSENSWENVSISTPVDGNFPALRQTSLKDQRDLRTNVLIDRGIYGKANTSESSRKRSFKLPKQPVVFIPSGMDEMAAEKEFDVSPKALFHVMFGDRSAVWQLLYHERQAQRIRQGPWTQPQQGHMRRDFEYEIEYLDILRRIRTTRVLDHQTVDSATEHLLYCISDRKTPWHLPYRQNFTLLSKIVITHTAKSKCKLAIYTKVEWTTAVPSLASRMIRRAALQDMRVDSLDLADVLSDQVRRLVGSHGRTRKAISIFGPLGQNNQISEFAGSDSPLNTRLRRSRQPRTLANIVLLDIGSLVETLTISIIQIIGSSLLWIWKTVNANSLILTVLAVSILINLGFSSRHTSEWRRERTATTFMSKLGVGYNHVMTKAIYINDIEDVISSEGRGPSVASKKSGSVCRNTFNSIMSLSDQQEGATPGPDSSQILRDSEAVRLQSKRLHLSSRRHDLMVALRIVNTIEQKILEAAWESWLFAEKVRCHHFRTVLENNKTELMKERRNELMGWHDNYCGSCEIEQRPMLTSWN